MPPPRISTRTIALFPDPTLCRARWSTATVIIAFPLFTLLARHLARETERQPVKRLSPVRRWLTYLTLFLAAVALICDVTTLVYNLLGGELSVRFVLKVLVVGDRKSTRLNSSH